jgi:hypothetical protein
MRRALLASAASLVFAADVGAQVVSASYTYSHFQNETLRDQPGVVVEATFPRKHTYAVRIGIRATERNQQLRDVVCSGFCNPQFQVVEDVHHRAHARELSLTFERRFVPLGAADVNFAFGGQAAVVGDHWRGDSTGFTRGATQYLVGPSVEWTVVIPAAARIGVAAAAGAAAYVGPHVTATDSFDPFGGGFTSVRGSIGFVLGLGPSRPK